MAKVLEGPGMDLMKKWGMAVPNHVVLTRRLHAYLNWRNANARHPDVLAAQRKQRARVRAEKQLRWDRPRAA